MHETANAIGRLCNKIYWLQYKFKPHINHSAIRQIVYKPISEKDFIHTLCINNI